MNWKFWKKEAPEGHAGAGAVKLAKPKELPEPVGRKMVVEMKMDPDVVWSLKYVGRPLEDGPEISEFRIFDPVKVITAGLTVKNWTSLDDRPELILFTGRFEKRTNRVDILPV